MIYKNKVHIIAEIGVNHNGDLVLAKKLMLEAKKRGADSVKFQTFNTDEMIIANTEKATYQIINTKNNESQYDMLKKYELNNNDYLSLIKYSKKINIELFSTACDIKSLQYLSKTLKLKTIKISSSDLTNIPLLLYAGSTKKNIIISSGMGNIKEVDIALSALSYGYANPKRVDASKFSIHTHKKYYSKQYSYLSKKVTLLHCTTEYPAPVDELNINVIDTFKKRYKISVGYSDHSNNMVTPIVATSKNINVIEVHITLDKNLSGPDHLCSLNLEEFEKYVKNIRLTESMLGSFKKTPTKSECKNINSVRKSLVIKKTSKVGDNISEKNLTVKRPGKGISSLHYNEYLGKTLKKNMKINQFLKKNDIKSK